MPEISLGFPTDVTKKKKEHPREYRIAQECPVASDRHETIAKALDLLVEGELKLLAIYDARQASADARTAALATAAVALPPLILSLSKSFNANSTAARWLFSGVVVIVLIIVVIRAWNAWRRRSPALDDSPAARAEAEQKRHFELSRPFHVSSESREVADARTRWRSYQTEKSVGEIDPIRVRQLELEMWRARADDSRSVAQKKDGISVASAVLLAIALTITGALVWTTHAK